jgi:hypothetical protein
VKGGHPARVGRIELRDVSICTNEEQVTHNIAHLHDPVAHPTTFEVSR